MKIVEGYKSREYKQMVELSNKLIPLLGWFIKTDDLRSDDKGLTNDLINGLEALKRRVDHFGLNK